MSCAAVVDVVIADLASLDSEVIPMRLLPQVSPEDQRRYASIRRSQRQKQFLAGRLLLREGLARGLGSGVGGDGLPQRANLSHSGNWVACAFSDRGNVGCDIEQITPRPIEALAQAVCSQRERECLAASSDLDRRREFYRYWTVKEAVSKACRQGLSMDFRALDISLVSQSIFYPTGIPAISRLLAASALWPADSALAVALGDVPGDTAWRWWHRQADGTWLATGVDQLLMLGGGAESLAPGD